MEGYMGRKSNEEESNVQKITTTKVWDMSIFSKYLKKTALLVILMTGIHITLVFVWNVTSINNKPYGFLDFVAKTPSSNFFGRRENGICPTTGTEDLIALDCFLGRK
jgi:hypothetical protein